MLFYNRVISADGKHSLRIEASEEIILKVVDIIRSTDSGLSDVEIRELIDIYRTIKLAAYPDLKKATNKKFVASTLNEEDDYFESPTSATVWKDQLIAAERVFNMMNVEEKAKLLFFIIQWHYQISLILEEPNSEDEENEEVVNEAESDIDLAKKLKTLCVAVGQEVIQLDKVIGLWSKIESYTSSLRINEESNIGKRDQDTEEFTFYIEDSRRVCNIATLSKIFLPLFAAMINVSKKQLEPKQRIIEGHNKFTSTKTKLIDTRVKEIYCVAFIEPLINIKDEAIYSKFCNYIQYFVSKMRRKQNDNECTDVFRNNSTIEIAKSITATEICKKFIKVSLNFECSNIMSIVHTDIGKRVRSFEKGPSSKTRIRNKAYFVRNVSASDEDDGRADTKSQLDVDSIYGVNLFDMEPQMKGTWDWSLDKYINKYGINEKDFFEVLNHNNKVIPFLEEHIALFINSIFVDDFGGANSIFMLTKTEVVALLTIVQFVAAKKQYVELAHRLSCNVRWKKGKPEQYQSMPLPCLKMMQSVEEVSKPILATLLPLKTRAIMEKDKDKSISLSAAFKNIFKATATYFAITPCYINTHPIIEDIMGDKREPQSELISDVEFLRQYCTIINEMI